MQHVRTETADTLRGLARGEPTVVEGMMGAPAENLDDSGLDPRAYHLVLIAVGIAREGPPSAVVAQVAAAVAAGVSAEDVLGVLVAVGPQLGAARVVSVAPEVMRALGLPPPPAP